MSKDCLPTQVDPIRFADNAAKLQGTFPLKTMQRLSTSLAADQGDVAVGMSFGTDDQGVRFLKGDVEATLTLQCQRCLEPFLHQIISNFSYGLVSTEKKVSLLPSGYDPLLIKEDILDISGIVEEELIVNLPLVPMHDTKDCKVKLPIVMVDETEVTTAEKENPFKVIELLKIKPKQ